MKLTALVFAFVTFMIAFESNVASQTPADTIAYWHKSGNWKYGYLNERIRGYRLAKLVREDPEAARKNAYHNVILAVSVIPSFVGGYAMGAAVRYYLYTGYFVAPLFFPGSGFVILGLSLSNKAKNKRHKSVLLFNASRKNMSTS